MSTCSSWRTFFAGGWLPGYLVSVAQLQPGDVNDLLRVAPKVWNAVENRLQASDVGPLDGTRLEQLFGSLSFQHALGFLNDRFEIVEQFSFGQGALFRKLGRTVACIQRVAQAGVNP